MSTLRLTGSDIGRVAVRVGTVAAHRTDRCMVEFDSGAVGEVG